MISKYALFERLTGWINSRCILMTGSRNHFYMNFIPCFESCGLVECQWLWVRITCCMLSGTSFHSSVAIHNKMLKSFYRKLMMSGYISSLLVHFWCPFHETVYYLMLWWCPSVCHVGGQWLVDNQWSNHFMIGGNSNLPLKYLSHITWLFQNLACTPNLSLFSAMPFCGVKRCRGFMDVELSLLAN